MFSLSGYARIIDDVTVTQLDMTTPPYIASPVSNGKAKVWGLEWDAKYAPFALRDLRANVARNWSRLAAVPGPDNRLASQVATSANLGLDYRHAPGHAVGLNLNLQFGG